MNKETLRMQMLAGIITEGQYKEEIEEIDSMGKIGKSYPVPGTETFPKPEREIFDFWKQYDLLNKGFEFIDLSIPNIKVGDDIVNGNGDFGELAKIKNDKYYVRFDGDYDDEPLTKFKKDYFEEFFLLNKR
jgi:hypothetical protein